MSAPWSAHVAGLRFKRALVFDELEGGAGSRRRRGFAAKPSGPGGVIRWVDALVGGQTLQELLQIFEKLVVDQIWVILELTLQNSVDVFEIGLRVVIERFHSPTITENVRTCPRLNGRSCSTIRLAPTFGSGPDRAAK